MGLEDYSTPDIQCPYCKHKIDGSMGVNVPREGDDDPNPQPRPGDITVCIRCGNASAFGKSMNLEKIDPEEMKFILLADPELREVIEKYKGIVGRLNYLDKKN